ncbi:tryptophan 7-halogenase [Shewanella sp. 1_MG-2023]|uniref:tryptophan halogenase family protein n=1 Tax=unclassified Shewanella TaxID=196818 RepID=UPI0026E28685|nr:MULTISPECIES: tryptophan halogenase family protein [unclassified Shewanella]MDO6611636.1 tryptophan 7-halogenase [Shewanella sp. 7_MG-2023]MDO6771491.1 tryptophan 7-halogenase [Shewanella sp. 2_MG-2023]MDO6793860.1 tryptophan 7-halogenase [Shewanella sp. 1_MG-2023]
MQKQASEKANASNKPIKKVVIAGGGTAGWMAAAALTKLLGKNLEVVLVESDQIGTVGVGEATIPTLHIFHRLLGIKEQDVMAATNATFKLGISFENWHDVGKDYIHSFGFLGKDCWACGFQHFWLKGQQRGIVSEIGDYCTEHLAAREGRFAVLPNQDYNHAYHMDATLYAKFLRAIAEQHGITRIEGKINDVLQYEDSGNIKALQLDSGEIVEGDLFLDCTGFRAMLIEGTLNTGFDDWSHWLPCDSAIAVQTKTTEKPIPYTRSIARDSGWQWRIPLQSRTGNGIVFCSKYMSDEDAKTTLMNNIEGEPLTDPRVIKFRTGSRRKTWHKNCVAIGLSSGFLEPLESTSIHLIQRGIVRLLQMFPSQGIVEEDINEFNEQTRTETENIRDFIVLHYKVTDRTDTRFWRYCKNMSVPSSLQHRIDMFDASGKVYKHGNELFGESSWIQVMMGQGLAPKQYHPIVDMMEDEELEHFLGSIKAKAKQKVSNLPDHYDFVQHYCKSKML